MFHQWCKCVTKSKLRSFNSQELLHFMMKWKWSRKKRLSTNICNQPILFTYFFSYTNIRSSENTIVHFLLFSLAKTINIDSKLKMKCHFPFVEDKYTSFKMYWVGFIIFKLFMQYTIIEFSICSCSRPRDWETSKSNL